MPREARVVLRNGLRQIGQLDYAHATVLLHVDSEVELRTRLRSCSREPDTVAWLEGALRGGDVFYDVGANVGAYSLLAAKIGKPAPRVVAFEPSAVNFAQLVRNIALNNCQDRIIPVQVALAGRTSLETFNYRGLESGQALHALGGATDQIGHAFQPGVRVPVLAFRLDDLIPQFALPRPTLMKIDVDGGELGVLDGATAALADPTLRSVLLETDEYGADHRRIVALLEGSGFVVAAKRAIVPDASEALAGLHNYIFQRSANSSAVLPGGGPGRR